MVGYLDQHVLQKMSDRNRDGWGTKPRIKETPFVECRVGQPFEYQAPSRQWIFQREML